MRNRPTGSQIRVASPVRALAQRFSFLLLVLAAIAMMMVGKVDTLLVEGLRTRATDAVVPILDALSRPVATATGVLDRVGELADLRADNERLRLENARLMQWQQAALRLDAENRSLRALLNYKPDPAATFVTARVVADPGGTFVRSVIVTAGRRDGVRKGQAALAGHGVIGRVVEVGEWSARVLLLTDLNARVPVVLEATRHRAVLSGDNTDQPRLIHLPPDASVAIGERVVTSGSGGLLPAGLPVGIVASVGDQTVKVEPMVDLDRLEHVQIVDYGLAWPLTEGGTRAGELP